MISNDTIVKLQERISHHTCRVDEIESSVLQRALKEFSNASGCTDCRGRGWIVTWDTMDTMSGGYHESATCNACDGAGRTTPGPKVLMPENTKYDSFRRGSLWIPCYTENERDERESLVFEIERLYREVESEKERWKPAPGKLVKVEKPGRGRKDRRVPVGVSGLVKKMWTKAWGTLKILIVDKHGQTWWPSASQIVVYDPEPDTKFWNSLEKKDREENGLPAVVTIQRISRKAALVKTTTGVEFWIPLSQVPEIKQLSMGQTASIMLPMWLAKQKGLVHA